MFKEIDVIALPWAERHGLHFFTEDGECEIRSAFVVDDQGETYHLTISSMDQETGSLSIHYGRSADRKLHRRSETLESSLYDLDSNLERAFEQISDWIRESGHTRTPVSELGEAVRHDNTN